MTARNVVAPVNLVILSLPYITTVFMIAGYVKKQHTESVYSAFL